MLLVIKRFPPNYIGQTFGLAFSGLLLTPMIPHPIARTTLASPLVMTLSEILGFKKGSKGAVGMAMVCLLGFGQMSFMFMEWGIHLFPRSGTSAAGGKFLGDLGARGSKLLFLLEPFFFLSFLMERSCCCTVPRKA